MLVHVPYLCRWAVVRGQGTSRIALRQDGAVLDFQPFFLRNMSDLQPQLSNRQIPKFPDFYLEKIVYANIFLRGWHQLVKLTIF